MKKLKTIALVLVSLIVLALVALEATLPPPPRKPEPSLAAQYFGSRAPIDVVFGKDDVSIVGEGMKVTAIGASVIRVERSDGVAINYRATLNNVGELTWTEVKAESSGALLSARASVLSPGGVATVESAAP